MLFIFYIVDKYQCQTFCPLYIAVLVNCRKIENPMLNVSRKMSRIANNGFKNNYFYTNYKITVNYFKFIL